MEMQPLAICAGVSYSDFWQMTYGEIYAVIKVYRAAEKQQLQNAAFAAYNAAALSRHKRFPRTLAAAFPSLFETESGWQTSKRKMARVAEAFNRNFRAKEANKT